MRVSDIMTTNVKTVRPDTRVRDVALLMCLHRVSGVPVTDEQGHLVGIISEKDILLATYPKVDEFMQASAPPSLEALEQGYGDVLHQRVRALMTPRVFTVEPQEAILKAASVMFVHRIRRIPVTNRDQQLVGIISLGDVHKAVFKEMFDAEFARVEEQHAPLERRA